MKCKCAYCGKNINKYAGHVNRARKLGLNIYCNRKCAGLGRRTNETKQEKKFIKYLYDSLLHFSDPERYKKRHQEYFKKDYAANPEKYKKIRQSRMGAHVEYCRRPEYKKKKKVYDQKYRANKVYGEYGEAFIALRQLQGIVDNRLAKKEQKNTSKSQKRKRYVKQQNSKCQKLEGSTMGLYQPS